MISKAKMTEAKTIEANKALVRRYREAHNTNNLALLAEFVDADIKNHSSIQDLPPGLEGDKRAHKTFLGAFTHGHVITLDLISEGDKVVERFSYRGINTGSFMGEPATGKKVTISGMSVFRIANGKIVEHWGENDALGTMRQLGFIQTPE